VHADTLAALGAFLSGIGSVLSAIWYVRRVKRSERADCERRIAEINRALHEGIEIGREDRPAR
jgi:hypothetical protein